GTKLIKMAQIRGFLSGPVPESKVITSKTTLPGSYSDSYWLAWNGVDIRTASRDRINLPKDVWERYSIGDRIEVFYFPGERWPYHRKDIYADNGNFCFDGVLVFAWLSGIAILSAFQIRDYLRNRTQAPPPLPRAFSQ